MKFSTIMQQRLDEEVRQDGKLTREEAEAAHSKLASLEAVPNEEMFFKNPDKEEVRLVDIGFGKHGKVYHLEDSDKAKIRRQRVDLDDIGKGQPNVQRSGVRRAIDMALDSDQDLAKKVPLIVHEDGVDYVQDGHHRTCAMILAGRNSMIADRVVHKDGKFYVPKQHRLGKPSQTNQEGAESV